MEAVRKSSFMPALRLESMCPQMRQKGRIKVGADADIAIFARTKWLTERPRRTLSSIRRAFVMSWSKAHSLFAKGTLWKALHRGSRSRSAVIGALAWIHCRESHRIF
jgi:hypothetical protein